MRYEHHFEGRKFPLRSALSAALLAATAFVSPDSFAAVEGDVEFDHEALRSMGIDPRLAALFREAPRFMPGETTVNLAVNGISRGKVRARFTDEGQLCVDKKFIKQAGLVTPPGVNDETDCFDLKSAWPQTELKLDPAEAQVDLVLPEQAIASAGDGSDSWNHGGVAGMLNYQAQYMDSAGSSASVNFMQLGTEAGFNFSDWIIRSRQTLTRFNGKDQVQHQAAYGQRSFTDSKKVLQVGQIGLSNSLFGTGQVLGAQVFPESALQESSGPALVEGIADSQSVVEVRQSGVLVYSTTVPAGPFRLQGFRLLNTRSDLDVTLTGSNGEKRQFVVPASALLLSGQRLSPGLSYGVGKMDQQGSSESPVLGTLANGWVLNPWTTLNSGVLASAPYRVAALGLDTQPFDATLLSLQATVANDNRHGNSGVSAVASVNYQLSESIGLSGTASQQTASYRELSDALQHERIDNRDQIRNQYSTGVSWSGKVPGSFSLSVASSSTFRGDTSYYVRGGWSKQFGNVYVGASVEHDTGTRTAQADNRFYLTLNIPLGESRSVSSYLNSARAGSRSGVRYSDRSSQDRGWSIASDRDFKNHRTSNTASMDLVTPVSQLSGSVNHDSDNYTTWSARATGGVVAHSGGVTLSPYQINDTFGVAKVGDEAGVRLDTPAGPTWTDSKGYAVLPSLSGYKRSVIQVDTRSLGKNVDIGNAWQETEAARGSVNYVNFDVVRTRRVLVDVKDAKGQPLPQGASVFDTAGHFITVVGEKGRVFIPDVSGVSRLDVQSSGITLCSFSLSLPAKADGDVLYETASAQCR